MSTGKRVLVTAGNTMVPIDVVRSITNIFKGKTGTEIAIYLADHGYQVTLVTSNPKALRELLEVYARQIFESPRTDSPSITEAKIAEFITQLMSAIVIVPYHTYDELYHAMEIEIRFNRYDIVIHSAAVSDYYVHAVCVEGEITPDSGSQTRLMPIDKSKKVSSDFDDVYLHLKKTPKIISLIREPWGFKGELVMFKLQVGISDTELMEIADKSRRRSKADIIVANCLEWSRERAIILAPTLHGDYDFSGVYNVVNRDELPARLLEKLENIGR